jgi:hypothetical protein
MYSTCNHFVNNFSSEPVYLCDMVYTQYWQSSSSSSSVIFQTTGPKPLAKRFLHIVRSRASSFNLQYPLLSLRSSSNFLRLLSCLLGTSICPFIFPLITYFRRQFLRKMWPIQLAFRFIISCRIFLWQYHTKLIKVLDLKKSANFEAGWF